MTPVPGLRARITNAITEVRCIAAAQRRVVSTDELVDAVMEQIPTPKPEPKWSHHHEFERRPVTTEADDVRSRES